MSPNLNLINIVDLNKVLRAKVFVSEDKQLRAIHLILDFKPLSDKFQDMGHTIRANDPRLALIDVLVPGFLAREDIMQVKLPSCRSPRETVVLREETAFSRLSLEVEINWFHLEEEREKQGDPVIQVSDSEGELDRFLGVRTSDFIVAHIGNSSQE